MAEKYFTVVFRGNIRKFDKSPFNIRTEFGEVVAVGDGNSFDEIEDLSDQVDKLMENADGND